MKSKMFMPVNFQSSLKLLVVLFFLGTKIFAQSPELTVKGDDAEKVRMSQLKVNVKIVGNIAYTTAEMHFFNSGTRQMEAELIFPLPENVSVSRYAIDINGKLREAVPVNKNKGKQVFEAIEHRRVDPGLLEKVDGNNFKTRIYPLMPNGERIVVIGYEEELSASDKDNLVYQLLSRYPKKLDKFEINVSVLGAAAKPVVSGESETEIVFSKWNQSFEASEKKENYQPSEKLLFKIPIQQNIPSVVMQDVGGQYYFYGNTFVEGAKTAKKTPASIGLIWDNSLSCQNCDLKKELDLLDAYFQKIKNTKVTLYFLNYTFEKQREFVISNGNWTELKAILEKTRYDGGTRFSQINFENQDEYLFFSDGLSSLSENILLKTKKPIYAITSSVSADFAFLNFSATKTGGNFINLNQANAQTALDKLTNTSLKFLGIKENLTLTDLFPMEGTSTSGNFSFSGISLNPKNEITLLFGYGNEAVLERKISLDATIQNTADINVEKLWAQKKIANLELQYAKNADEIEMLGKKFGIVTKNTSLIVLENVRDYIMYDILPPAELRAEFDQIKKQERDATLAQQKNNWENIESYFNSINVWWKQNLQYSKPKAVKSTVVNTRSNNNVSSTTLRRSAGVPAGFVSGFVFDEDGAPLPGVNVVVQGVREGAATDFDGKFSVKASENSNLTFSFIGYESVQVNVRRNNQISVRMYPNSHTLSEVVTTGYGTIKGDPDAALTIDEPVGTGSAVVIEEDNNVYNTAPQSTGRLITGSPVTVDIKDKKVGSEKLEEAVVVVGYGSQKKSDVTGAVANASKSKDISQALEGKVAGVQIGENVTDLNKGYLSNDSRKQLLIVDGQVYAGELTDLNLDDIESAEVVKDASRIAVYGPSGANGVIIITTKKKSANSVVQTKSWNPDRLYLKALASAPKEKQYDLYFELRKANERNPSFYFDVAHFFYNQGDVKKALLIVSNIADLGLENHQLYKTLTYTLRQWKDYQDAVFTAKQVVKWREHEPQSLRDYALTLEDAGKYQQAFDELIKSLEVNYYGEMSGQYEGVEDVILMDINRLMAEHPNLKTGKLNKKYLAKMPVDIRIIMNWNLMDVDLDLHVIEPTNEECYYAHPSTQIGGRFSKDFTEGYGPEQYIIRNAVKGKYQIKTNFFGETELTENGPSTVMVEIYTTKTGKVSRTLKTIQIDKVKENETLAEIIW
ncbi:carboxypeptidase-like regulatory domain-containing protein [Flavobacterium sp. 17A]|uniref:Carboxypeptidase-like regulatory domain-containing protein n=1 Tax=Flavobacterium potami TaxID=2872310 RepID=A0A9X1HFG5_9FLAO|nr:VIT domain-containing protein [Flavobacterium potami]MBZ4037197.1 carboxypeptidase-like regulatory domain-containing protein [Flavobacterium potami]